MHLRLRSGDQSWKLPVVLALFLGPCGAWAHGDWPARHGGVMNDGGETSFELVREKRGIVAHVSDHGEPMDVSGGRPELQIRRPGTLQRVKGVPGGTRIVFPAVVLRPGDELGLTLVSANGSVAFGRFTPAAVAALVSGKVSK